MTDPLDGSRSFEFIGPHREALKVSFGELDFEGVVMRVFPLRANLNRLTTFCNRYLNMDIQPEIAHFEPALPYVLMMVINYGRMADSVSNMGWVAQNEILFAVPLAGRWNQDGRMIQEPAIVSPFIFVDNAWSIATGREVYGWPKMPVWLEPGLNTWLQDPRSPRRLMTLKTKTLAELYQGRETEARTLLEIEQDPPRIFGQMPPNLEYLFNPLVRLPKAVVESLAAAPDFLQSLTRVFQMGANSDLPSFLGRIFGSLSRERPELHGNTINLKQFRSSEPGMACYQALVNSRMIFKRYNAGGLMGSFEFLRGDPTGGFSIYLHDLPAFPIVDSLGLEVERIVDRLGTPVAQLKPLLPFWASLDMGYKKGRRICYRTSGTHWQAWKGEQTVRADAAETSRKPPTPTTKDELHHPFNTTLGAVVEAIQGPFDFFDSTIRVLPIPARTKALEKLLPDLTSLGIEDDDIEILPMDSENTFVYLVVTSYGEMSAAENDIGWWAQNEVSLVFAIRLWLWVEIDDGKNEVRVPLEWLCWPYMFADSTIAVTEGREVLGLPTAYAKISKGVDPWLDPTRSAEERQLLALSTMDYPSVGYGQRAQEQLLLEVKRSEPTKSKPCPDSATLDRFKRNYLKDYGSLRFFNLSLKEFRDEEEPGRPCYQSLVAFDRSIGRWAEGETNDGASQIQLKPLTGKYEVTFHSTPSWPLIEKLGLEHRRERSKKGEPVGVCPVVEPFLIRGDVRADLPSDLIHSRMDTPSWEDSHSTYFSDRLQTRLKGSAGQCREKTLEDLRRDLERLKGKTPGTATPTSVSGGDKDKQGKKHRGWIRRTIGGIVVLARRLGHKVSNRFGSLGTRS